MPPADDEPTAPRQPKPHRTVNATAHELRARAAEALLAAQAAVLPRIRERHEKAAARWLELAAMRERVDD